MLSSARGQVASRIAAELLRSFRQNAEYHLPETPDVRVVGALEKESTRFLFPFHAIDEVLSERLLPPPFVRVFRDGVQIDPSAFSGPTDLPGMAHLPPFVNRSRVVEQFLQGATLVLQHLQAYWGPVMDLAKETDSLAGCRTEVHAFISPSNAASEALPLHADPHDILILQTTGMKRWRFWDAGAQPAACAGKQPTLVRELAPGDLLYLPAHTPHVVEPMRCDSVHLAIGLRFVHLERRIAHLFANPPPQSDLARILESPRGRQRRDLLPSALVAAAAAAATHEWPSPSASAPSFADLLQTNEDLRGWSVVLERDVDLVPGSAGGVYGIEVDGASIADVPAKYCAPLRRLKETVGVCPLSSITDTLTPAEVRLMVRILVRAGALRLSEAGCPVASGESRADSCR